MNTKETPLAALTAKIVTAYLSNNTVQQADIVDLIIAVERTLRELATGMVAKTPLKPVVSIRDSVADDYIICLEDGCRRKSLKRHLRTAHGLTPSQYRVKWNLAANYPIVCREYSKRRSTLAKDLGLGRTKQSRSKHTWPSQHERT